MLEYIENGIVNDDDFVRKLDALVNQADEDKAWVSNMWEGVTFEETIQNEIHALKRVAAEADARAAAKIAESEEETKMLTNYLLDNNRIEDLRHCANDPDYKQQLMKELGI